MQLDTLVTAMVSFVAKKDNGLHQVNFMKLGRGQFFLRSYDIFYFIRMR